MTLVFFRIFLRLGLEDFGDGAESLEGETTGESDVPSLTESNCSEEAHEQIGREKATPTKRILSIIVDLYTFITFLSVQGNSLNLLLLIVGFNPMDFNSNTSSLSLLS